MGRPLARNAGYATKQGGSHPVLALEEGVQIPCAIDEYDDMDFVVIDDSVDQPVAARDEQFPQPFVSPLWNDPTSPRELTKRFRCRLGFSLQNDGISRRITRDEPGLLLDVRPRRGSSTLLSSPRCDPLFDFLIRDEVTTFRGLEPCLDLLLNVDVVLDVFVRHLIWKSLEQTPEFSLRD